MTRASMFHFIQRRDHGLMRRVNRWQPPRWVRLWMLYASRAGDGWIWYAIGLVLLFFGGPMGVAAVATGTATALLGISIFLRIKKATGRRRPCEYEPHCWAKLLPPDQFSFPSGHTITAFGVAVSVGSYYPSLMMGLLFIAVSVAASRILLGMHFLSDVIVGAAIGTGLAYFVLWLSQVF